MNDQIPGAEDVQRRYRSIDYKSSNSKSFNIMQVVMIFLVISPLAIIFGLIFAVLFFGTFGIHLDLGKTSFVIFVIIFSVLFFLFFYFVIFEIIFVIITFVTYKRTNYRGYLFESFIELQLLLLPVFLGGIYLFVTHSNFAVFFLIIPIAIEYKLVKKPLIYGSSYYNYPFSGNTLTSESADIISSHSVYINNFEDGYSTRPVVESFKDSIPEKALPTIKEHLQQFASFLAINGDLIGYDVGDNKLKMYLRTRFIQKKQLFNPLITIRKAKLLLKKIDLSTVIIDLDTFEISFKLNKNDYDYLSNITFYELSDRILKQFKSGIKEFLENNYEDSYKEINPDNNAYKSYILTDGPQAFLVIGYIVSCFIMGPILYLVSISLNFLSSLDPFTFFFLNFIGWPLALYFDFFALSGQYQNNYLLFFQEQYITIISVLLGALISLLVTIMIYHYLRERALKLQVNRKRKIKVII